MNSEAIKTYIIQFKDTILTHKEAVLFIRDNKLWEGFWKYGWVSRLLIGLAFLMGLKLWSILTQWWRQSDMSDVAHTFTSMGTLAKNMASESYNFLFVGGLKYVMLILLEVIIFHVCRKTLEILSGKSGELSFNDFVNAQIRMIKVVIRCYIMEMIFTFLIRIFFGIFGAVEFLEPVAIFGVQCYFLGLVVIDNYNEQFDMPIKESVEYVKQFIGVSVAIGVVMNLLLLIPAFGPIIAPVIGAVTATLVMFRITDLHLRERDLPPDVAAGNEQIETS